MGKLHEKFKIVIELLKLHFSLTLLHGPGDKSPPLGCEDLIDLIRDCLLDVTDFLFDPHLL